MANKKKKDAMSKRKQFIIDFIYVSSWALGLLYASFYKMFEADSLMAFLGGNDFTIRLDNYIIPMSMAMILFVVDAIHQIFKASEALRGVVATFLGCFVFYWVLFLFSLKYTSVFYGMFFGAWAMLFIMKLVTTFWPQVQSLPRAQRPIIS